MTDNQEQQEKEIDSIVSFDAAEAPEVTPPNVAAKASLEEAGGGEGDPAWASGGIERMYFEHPTCQDILGSVEIDTSGPVEEARLEMFAPVDVVAAILKFVRALPISEPAPIKAITVVEASVAAVLSPTRDPVPEDELEEPDGLPPEVLEGTDLDQVEV